ncbi:hypothetical protein [Nocardia sp. NPDC003726]
MSLAPRTHSLAVFRHLRQLRPIDAAFAATIGEEYDRAFAVAEEAERRMLELKPPASYDTAAAEVIASGQMPEDFLAWVMRHTSPKAQYDAERTALEGLRARAANVCANAVSSRLPQLLGHLHQQLTDLIDRARPAAETLAEVTEAEDVIRAGAAAVEAFGVLDQCWTEYTEIRTAQFRLTTQHFDPLVLTSCRSDRCSDEAASDTYYSNLDDLYPEWRERPGQPSSRAVFGADPGVPWPDRGPLQLKWFIDHGAKFWVPTEKQIGQLHSSRAQRNSALSYELTLTPEQRERMRAEQESIEQGKRPRPGPEQRRRDNAQRHLATPGLGG